MKIGVVGMGLIGGSIALDLKAQIHVTVYGIDQNQQHLATAYKLGLMDEAMTLENAEISCDVVILAIPVSEIEKLLPQILNRIDNSKVIIDLGSTKAAICAAVANHPMRGRYVAAHPLAGTEYSGPEAALKGLFNKKKNIICEAEKSDADALDLALKIFSSLGLNTITMPADEHDKHLAYVSHLSHVSSFMLGLTVLNIEKDEKQIFNLAGTGFESTVRLAKSNPNTWKPIFIKNKKHLSDAMSSYINLLQKFKDALDQEDIEVIYQYMQEANEIKRIIK